MDEQLNIDGVVIDVVVKKIRNVRLGVYPPDGRVKLSVPKRLNPDLAKAFVVSKLPWIKKQQARLRDMARQAPRTLVDGEFQYLFGRKYTLKVVDNKSAGGVVVSGTALELHIRKNTSVVGRRKIMSEWYRSELKKAIPGLMRKWEARIGVSASGFGVKSMKTRWGSCNRRTRMIWINLELARRSEIFLEYVIVHELVHLLEPGHNDRFRKYMSEFIPEWRKYRRELNGPIAGERWSRSDSEPSSDSHFSSRFAL